MIETLFLLQVWYARSFLYLHSLRTLNTNSYNKEHNILFAFCIYVLYYTSPKKTPNRDTNIPIILPLKYPPSASFDHSIRSINQYMDADAVLVWQISLGAGGINAI